MLLRCSRFVLGAVALIMVATPLMPQVALSHNSAESRHSISSIRLAVDEAEPGEATLDAEMFAHLEFILSLDDEQADMFQQALDLSGDSEALAEFLIDNSAEMLAIASLLPAGSVLQAETNDSQDPLTEEDRQLLDHCGTANFISSSWWSCFLGHIIVEPVQSVVNGVQMTANTILGQVNQIVSDIESFIQDAADKIAEFGQDVMNFFQDISNAAFGFIGEIRGRYLAWVGNDCDGASACGQFRANLSTFFGDIVGVEQAIAAMVGPVAVHLPGVPNNQAAILQATSAIPHFLLWPLAEVLELLPLNWWEIPTRVGAMLPDIGSNARTPWEIINDAENSSEPFDLCSHFALDGTGNISPLPHSNIDVYAMSLLTSGLGIVEAYVPDDLTIDVLGEGSTVMSHPLKLIFTPIKQFVDLVGTAMGQVNDLDTTCATEAFREAVTTTLTGIETSIADLGGSQLNFYIEEQLSFCTVVISLYLPAANGGQLEVVRDLVDGLISEVEAAGLSSNGARAVHNQGLTDMSAGEYRRAYLDFCASYRLLRYGNVGGTLYQGTGEIWACISDFTGAMRRVNRDPTIQPGDPAYYVPPADQCTNNERLVEMYGYDVSGQGSPDGGRR